MIVGVVDVSAAVVLLAVVFEGWRLLLLAVVAVASNKPTSRSFRNELGACTP